jgi:NACHT domain
LARIFEWIEKDDEGNNILWLHGPAGVGKSAIARTVAEHRAESKELAASFFFSRDKPGCDTARLLWATIAFQIAISIPALRSKIGEAVEKDPAICQKSLLNQLQKLVVDPFTFMERKLKVMNMLSRLPFLVVIDGLDECKTQADQRDVLRSIANIINLHQIPLRFLITSRSEDPIRSEFDSPILQSVCFRIFHAETLHPEHDEHWQLLRSTSESRWKPFFDPDMRPTPMFTTLMAHLFSHLDSSNSGFLYPEVSSNFLDELDCPLHKNVCTCINQKSFYMLLM